MSKCLPTRSVIGTRKVQCLYWVKSFNVLPATNCVWSMLSRWLVHFSSSFQRPPWQRWWWQRASSGACAQPSLIVKKMASTACGSTVTIMKTRSGSPLWAPRSRCLPTSFRTRVKVMRRHCMPTKSEVKRCTNSTGGSLFLISLLNLIPGLRTRLNSGLKDTLFCCTNKLWGVTQLLVLLNSENAKEILLVSGLKGWMFELFFFFFFFFCTISTWLDQEKKTEGHLKKTKRKSDDKAWSAVALIHPGFESCSFFFFFFISEPLKSALFRPLPVLPGWGAPAHKSK